MSASTAKRLSLTLIGWTNRDADNFWSHVDTSGECWLWNDIKGRYSYFGVNGKIFRTNRLAYALAHDGETPEGLEVCHTCDNDKCVRPSHLFIGTRDDNMHDMANKGRSADKSGVLNGRCKLSATQALEIFRRASDETRASLGREFGVSDNTIRGIVFGRLWSHVTGKGAA